MKSIVISVLLLNFSILLFAQNLQRAIVLKPAIDTSVFGRWPSAEIPTISNDGNYALYMIRHQPAEGATLVIRSLKNQWKKEIVNASGALFSADSRKVIFINPRKNLCILKLESGSMDSVAATNSYQLVKQRDNELLCFQLDNDAKELKIVSLNTNVEKSFKGVIDHLFSSDGNVLILLKRLELNNPSQSVEWVNFPSGNTLNIWSGTNARSFVLNEDANQLAFIVETKDSISKDDNIEKSIFFCRAGKEKAELLADNRTKGIDSNLIIDGISDGFSKDGEKLYISLKEKERPKANSGSVMVDVWSYQDIKLQSMQLLELTEQKLYTAAIRIKDRQVVRLQQEGDRHISIVDQWPNKVYVTHYTGDILEAHWNAASREGHYLVSIEEGGRKKLVVEPQSISPFGKYIIGKLAEDKQNLYCYNILTGKIINITQQILAPFDKEYDDKPRFSTKWLEMGSWLENEMGFVLFDRYDMWLVDPDGTKLPINLTNGYGQKNKIVFRLPEVYTNKFISEDGKLIIKAFNRKSKEEGFYYIEIGNFKNGPKALAMGQYNYEIPNTVYNSIQLQAPGPQSFLVRRESATESPNYFLTSDFKIFTPVTDIHPEALYSWLTSELHTWKSLNGKSLQGILYKPQSFDPKKKYPVIFHYYERFSDKRNKYLMPDAITDHLNIPWFVSNGYLVFTPDIHYEVGKTGESALNAVVSAAHYLAKYSWINVKKMGIQGQSFGGYETDYIVTHSNLFAAAMSSAGVSDFVSAYGEISHGGRSRQQIYEIGQSRMGVALWGRPDLYIENSPIFKAYKVTTPVLMMNNKNDRAVPFSQGVEFFTALRRLGKRVWLLQYDYGDHALSRKEDGLQHTIRITQFFDHYLKDSACPRWMLYGIPAKMKAIDDGLQLVKKKDHNGNWMTPDEGLLISEEKKRLDTLKKRPSNYND